MDVVPAAHEDTAQDGPLLDDGGEGDLALVVERRAAEAREDAAARCGIARAGQLHQLAATLQIDRLAGLAPAAGRRPGSDPPPPAEGRRGRVAARGARAPARRR